VPPCTSCKGIHRARCLLKCMEYGTSRGVTAANDLKPCRVSADSGQTCQVPGSLRPSPA
jgi:hypothetical protein